VLRNIERLGFCFIVRILAAFAPAELRFRLHHPLTDILTIHNAVTVVHRISFVAHNLFGHGTGNPDTVHFACDRPAGIM
jgi:hypothetical protein